MRLPLPFSVLVATKVSNASIVSSGTKEKKTNTFVMQRETTLQFRKKTSLKIYIHIFDCQVNKETFQIRFLQIKRQTEQPTKYFVPLQKTEGVTSFSLKVI